jgi:hypothetical protein
MWSDIANEEKGIPKNIDLAANRQCLDTWRGMLQRGELITVSTPYTKEYVLREIGQEHENKILISPNCINFVEFPKIELADHPDEVRILWQGSKTHWEDLWALREPLIRVMEKYPHANPIWRNSNIRGKEIVCRTIRLHNALIVDIIGGGGERRGKDKQESKHKRHRPMGGGDAQHSPSIRLVAQ